ncbi:hypothetical protein SprV_0301247000 [Sparganum proliferum]
MDRDSRELPMRQDIAVIETVAFSVEEKCLHCIENRIRPLAMDAVVVLCHFCEQHGPAVIMSTQPFRQTPSQSSAAVHKTSNGPPIASSSCGSFTIMAAESAVWRGDSANITTNNLYEYIASSVSATQSSGAVQESNLSNQHTGTCRACSFVTREEIGYVSQDFTAKTAYVSTQFPVDPAVASIVRSACMRSLSCEVLPGREGPVYFGDDVNGHVISYAFFIKDHNARGYQVKYSFLVISWDQIFLMNLWPFIVKNVERMASRLQRAGSRVYEDEAAAAGRSVTPPVRSSRTPPRVSLATTPPLNFTAATSPPPPPLSMAGTPTASGYHRQQHQNPPLLSSQAIAAGNAVAGSQLGVSSGGGGGGGGKSVGQRRATDSDMRSLADLTKDDQACGAFPSLPLLICFSPHPCQELEPYQTLISSHAFLLVVTARPLTWEHCHQ